MRSSKQTYYIIKHTEEIEMTELKAINGNTDSTKTKKEKTFKFPINFEKKNKHLVQTKILFLY